MCVSNIPGRGRKEILSASAKRKIIRSVKKNPLLSAPKLASSISSAIGEKISAETVRRVLHNARLHGRIPVRKPLINCVNRKKRLSLAKKHISKPESFWNTVIFSDERKFNLYRSDGQYKVWRQVGKELDPKNTIKAVKYGGGSVPTWGCMSAGGVGELVFIDGIMDKMVCLEI
ncbi:transposable element Tc1 transposase [Trichonephila clavipes]|nr:transposable element Tc1 transposase [Trichonephila clavipes]